MYKSNAEKIAQGIGKLLDVDTGGSNAIMCKRDLRVRVEFEIADPLVIGFISQHTKQISFVDPTEV